MGGFTISYEKLSISPISERQKFQGGGKLGFVNNDFIAKRVKYLETKVSETMFTELKISRKKWFILLAYETPKTKQCHVFPRNFN